MVNLQLFVEGRKVDLFDFESVVLVDSIQNVKDINKIFIPFTRTFTIPASANNNKLFRHFYNEHIDGFDPRQKRNAQLELNSQTFKIGKLKTEGAILKNGKVFSYKVTFYGDTVDLKDTLGDATIASLGKLEELFLHDWTALNVRIYTENGIDVTLDGVTYTDALIYPLISHASRLTYDSSAEALNNLYIDTGASPHNGGVWWQDLKPAILINVILKAIEADFPTINFSDDFFNNTNTDVNNLYMWTHSTNENVAQVDERGFTEVPMKFSDLSIASENLDEVVISDDGFILEITEEGDFAATGLAEDKNVSYLFDILIENKATSIIDVILHEDGKGEIARKRLTPNTLLPHLAIRSASFGFETNSGRYKLYFSSQGTLNIGNASFGITRRKNRGIFRSPDLLRGSAAVTFADGSTSLSLSEQFIPTRVMSKMKIIDFLAGLFKMFNLTAFKEGNEIVIKPLKDFYGDSDVLHDITEYVDRTQTEISTDLPYRKIDFKYLDAKTILAKNHADIFGKEWGADEYRGNNNTFFFGGEYEVELPFEHMKFEKLFDESDNSETNYMVGTALDENLNKTATPPLLFYAVKSSDFYTDGTEDLMVVNTKDGNGDPDSVTIINSYYIPTNYQDLSNDSQNLHFFPEVNEYYLGGDDADGNPFDGTTAKSLFETFYRDYIEGLFRRSRRIVKLKAKLPLSFHLSFSLADDIRIFDKVYRVNEIKTNFLTGISELELLNLLERVQYRDFDAGDYVENVNKTGITIDRLLPTIDKTRNALDGGKSEIVTIIDTIDTTETKADNGVLGIDSKASLL